MKFEEAIDINQMVGYMLLTYDKAFPTQAEGSPYTACRKEMKKIRTEIADYLLSHTEEGDYGRKPNRTSDKP